MTTIGPQSYAATYAAAYRGLVAPPAPGGTQSSQNETSTAGGASVNVTLSEAAKAALKAQADPAALDSVVAAARAAIDKLLADAKATTALVDGQPTIDMSGLDRRSLFAVTQGAGFTAEEQAVASYTLAVNFEGALAGPAAASRVTGDYAAIYKAGLDHLDKAGPEEKASAAWTSQRDALVRGYQQAAATPGALPDGIPNDPVAAYMTALGGAAPATASRDILDIASDVRAALDTQYGAAGGDTDQVDLSSFDDRSLAAIVLDKGDQFSAHEIALARNEVKARSAATAANYGPNAASSDSLGRDLITRYASMSDEERQAQGWTPALYQKLVSNYQLSQKLASMSAGSSANPYLAAPSETSSVLDYLT